MSFYAVDSEMLSKKMAEAIQRVPKNLLDLTESELRKEIKPNKMLYSLRNSFWKEVERARERGQNVKNSNVVKNICTEVYFYRVVLNDPKKLAWIVTPAQNYRSQIEALADKATDRLDELLSIELFDEKGKFDVRRGELVLKAISEATNRAKGLPLSRSENKTATIGIHKVQTEEVPQNMIEADRKIAELQKALGIEAPKEIN